MDKKRVDKISLAKSTKIYSTLEKQIALFMEVIQQMKAQSIPNKLGLTVLL